MELYSDKLRLSVVNLTQINLSIEEDKAYQIARHGRTITGACVESGEPLQNKRRS